jgi:glucose-1-phosphate cytidylyltransferase
MMKVLILAGGMGTRISEESGIRPKPMVEIGNWPILWHVMKTYSHYGFNDFVILLGYKGSVIKEYFANYYLNQSSICIDLSKNTMETIQTQVEPWKITLLDTGADTLTGGRVLRARDIVGNEPFLLTYGDGVADVDVHKLIAHHKASQKLATMTVVQPGGKFGIVDFDSTGQVTSFTEKPQHHSGWINGGFFVCEPQVFDYIPKRDNVMFEHDPLEGLVRDGQLGCYEHHGFWKCMDTLSDKNTLNELWNKGKALWKVW